MTDAEVVKRLRERTLVEGFGSTVPMWTNDLNDAADLIEAQQEEIARLREALAFYADPDSYFAMVIMADPPCGEFSEDFSEDHSGDYDRPMPGKRARAALQEAQA